MPSVKCTGPDCHHTISYFCHKVTVLHGVQAEDKKDKETGRHEEKKIKRTLTLQCYKEHRNNYEIECDE